MENFVECKSKSFKNKKKMKRDIKQTSDIRGLEFFNTIDNNYKFDAKNLTIWRVFQNQL